MRKTLAVARKELRQAVRDPLSLLLLLGLPTFMLLLYGYTLNFDVRNVALAVQDRDKSARSRELIDSFTRSGYFDLVASLPAGTDLEEVTERRQARAILVIPEGYSRRIASGETGRVQFLLDGSDANSATAILGYASGIAAEANAELWHAFLRNAGRGSLPLIRYAPRVWYNPELRSTHFLVPGLIGFILMLTAVLSTALALVREKEFGTMEQLQVAPLRTRQLLVGKTLPYLGISLIATVLILSAARFLFGVEIRGPVLDLFAATLIYLIGALGFGLFVSSVSHSQAMAFQVGVITSMLPALLLSGFVFPIRTMPQPLQWVTYAVPARYYLVILRGVILKGAGLATYARQAGFLLIYAVAVLSIASLRLARREG
ncbi:MAG TPA: ABC transporter permease [Candidatus Deferrimicrobiaceae bacterium]|nr:ABC transporter permease [Candidatus Deferrimicrobiaceae bacterium]